MKALLTICLTGSLIVGALAPLAAAERPPGEATAMERLVRQEDARRNDPRLGITSGVSIAGTPLDQPDSVDRLTRQEDARRNDPGLGITHATPVASVPTAPRIEVVTRDGFDWLDAAIGAAAGIALAAGMAGATLVVRAREPRHV